jgi:hypothetical protein
MPKVVDAARVTTKDGAVWRHCTTCDTLAPLAPDAGHCPTCVPVPEVEPEPVDAGWERAYRYAELVGRIQAWAEAIPGVPDDVRVAKIRQFLAAFAAERAGGRS